MSNANFYESFSQYNAAAEGDTKVLRSNNANRPDMTYLSWAAAWQQVLKLDPFAVYQIMQDNNGSMIHRVGKGAMVVVRVTIQNHTKEEYYPIESMPTKSIDYENITPTAVNKAIKRGLVKCIALFGLALNLYIGEDLTEAEKDDNEDTLKSYILNAKSIQELTSLYNANKSMLDSAPKLIKLFTARKSEIMAEEAKKASAPKSRLIKQETK